MSDAKKPRVEPREGALGDLGPFAGRISDQRFNAIKRIRITDADDPTPEQALTVVLRALVRSGPVTPGRLAAITSALDELGMTYKVKRGLLTVERVNP